MILSKIDDECRPEFDIIRTSDHIETVWNKTLEKLPEYMEQYFQSMLESDGVTKLQAKFGHKTNNNPAKIILDHLAAVIKNYDEEKEPYDRFFDRESLEEYEEDPALFKTNLSKLCPVIRGALNSKSLAMKEWKDAYKRSKGQDLFDVTANLLRFADNYHSDQGDAHIEAANTWEDLDFSDVETEGYGLLGVIGTGIKATFLYYCYPAIFPGNFQRGVFSLYFLTQMEVFRLPSNSSQFVMVKDDYATANKNFKTEYNYFFPYPVYALYCVKIYRELKDFFEKKGLALADPYRFVHTGDFFNFVTKIHAADIQTLHGADEIEEKYG